MAISNSPAASAQPGQLQLHDIHVPDQISNLPIAPGWWILLAILIYITFWSYKKYKNNTRLNADKKQALAILASNEMFKAKECIALLKWAAMQYFSRQQIAKLYGKNFQDFLVKQLPEKHQDNFNKLITAGFDSQYQAEHESTSTIDKDCQDATRLWLSHALPIQKTLDKVTTAELSQ